ncbi:hypothetical protein ERICIV_04644 (plasmid) [Paenibacillus larvae subsp. larvae]|uniref:Uncharacterized protein n=1 Tax=Paenibacillus larvae subsp. larvae TaxID=147375 RepID=A0A2L1U7X6_9BACL|nr:hypothetical protein [Paenibacillus larvae]AQT87060.1 hypothetical protein B1222_23830 [Paenibacillus larvae subsp. pulvifaciens]AQZ49377.1 hypothetical protein B5S25_23020 [Paenibacillus larvae subsp. pulvifaciens]AVF29023.1 hypothetical protein ERICIII_05024 [Paenibacillus larvae subsp. larvae]AVF33405.1 hypothetical protein ERICIV_04644 [Paenibacillus larvae subsp. larvae]MBH0342412.1 hypothetical protein [Paenibacillus larvae]
MKSIFESIFFMMMLVLGLVFIFNSAAYVLSIHQTSTVVNRSMMLVQMKGGVDANVKNIVESELSSKGIKVHSVSGSQPGRPYGDQIHLTISATTNILGEDRPIGQQFKGTSIYRERK